MKKVIGTVTCQDEDSEMIYTLLLKSLQLIQAVMTNKTSVQIDMIDTDEIKMVV